MAVSAKAVGTLAMLAVLLICAGDATVGPIATRSQAERFGWLVAPASTVVQPSPVHTGLGNDPAALFATMVRLPRNGTKSV